MSMNSSELNPKFKRQANAQSDELETKNPSSHTQADQVSTHRPSTFLTTRKLWAFALIAALAACAVAYKANHLSYDDMLVRIQAEKGLGYLGKDVLK